MLSLPRTYREPELVAFRLVRPSAARWLGGMMLLGLVSWGVLAGVVYGLFLLLSWVWP